MPRLMPRLLRVSSQDKKAAYSSIQGALALAVEGDTVLVGEGRYSPSSTGEKFPLYVPPGVALVGAGTGVTTLDGEGAQSVSWRPMREEQSLVLLGNNSTLCGFTVQNSGGHGVGVQPGARALIADNEIQQNGEHGILVVGPEEVVIQRNVMLDNGTRRYSVPVFRVTPVQPGHHIFVCCKGGMKNRVVINDNTLKSPFADAIAFVALPDEPDGVVGQAYVSNNTIERCGRFGMIIAGSFGPSGGRLSVDVRRNVFRESARSGLLAVAACPLLEQHVRDTRLSVTLADNVFRDNNDGLTLWGGFGPSDDNCLDAVVLRNVISGSKGHAIRLISGFGHPVHEAHGNLVRAVIARNTVEGGGTAVPILAQGATYEGKEGRASANQIILEMAENTLPERGDQKPLTLNDGPQGNSATLKGPGQPHARIEGLIPFP